MQALSDSINMTESDRQDLQKIKHRDSKNQHTSS